MLNNNNDKQIVQAVNDLDIKSSRTLDTQEITQSTLLSNDSIGSNIQQSGTVLATQNNMQVADISRVKDRADLVEIDWNYKNITSKPYVIHAGEFNQTHGVNDMLLNLELPNAYFLSNHILNTVGNTFSSFRGDLHLVVTLQGTPTASGALMVYTKYGLETLQVQHAFSLQSAILDASDNTSTVDIVIPFKHIRNACDPFEKIMTCSIQVLTALQGSTRLYFTVTAFLENQVFKFLRPSTTVFATRTTQGLFNYTSINNNLSNIENATLPTNMTGDELNLIMDDVGIPTNPTAVIVKFNSLNNSTNPHSIEKAAINSSAVQVSSFDTFNTKIDEMSFEHIFKEREHFIGSQIIPINVIPGNPLYVQSISPTANFIEGVQGKTMMEAFASTGKFWRGGIKIKLRFIMNRFQSIKLYFGMFYKNVAPTTFVDWSASHGVILDIGGNEREVTVEIPYNSETAWLQNATKTVDASFLSDIYYNFWDFVMGQFAVYPVTGLVNPSGENNTVTMIITMQGAEDFEIANYNPDYRMTQADIVMLSKHSDRTPNYITDTLKSVKDLTNKWYLFANSSSAEVDVKTRSEYIGFFPAQYLLQGTDAITWDVSSSNVRFRSNARSNTLDFVYPYTGYRGSLKVRIEATVSFNALTAMQTRNTLMSEAVPHLLFCNPNFSAPSTGDNYNIVMEPIVAALQKYENVAEEINTPYVMQRINPTGERLIVFEFEIPFQRNLKWMNMRDRNALDSYGLVLFGLDFPTFDTGLFDEIKPYIDYKIFLKTGDDGRFGIINRPIVPKDDPNNWSLNPYP